MSVSRVAKECIAKEIPKLAGRRWRRWQAFEGIPQVQVIDDGLEPDEWRLLEDVLVYPDDGIRRRYLRLASVRVVVSDSRSV